MTLLAQNPETDPEIHSPYKYLPQSSRGSPFLQHFPRIPHSSAVRVKVKRVTDEQWGRDSLMSTGEITLGARVSLGQGACSSPWGTPWRGTGAAVTPAVGRRVWFGMLFPPRCSSPWDPQHGTRRGWLQGMRLEMRRCSLVFWCLYRCRDGVVEGVNFNLRSPLRSGRCCCSDVGALHNGESECCAETQCGAECLAHKW